MPRSGIKKVARRETSGSGWVAHLRAKRRAQMFLRAPPVRGGLGHDSSRGFTSGYRLRASPARSSWRRGKRCSRPSSHVITRRILRPSIKLGLTSNRFYFQLHPRE